MSAAFDSPAGVTGSAPPDSAVTRLPGQESAGADGHGGEATMADVAERAGVSVSTVSRTLRGLSSVSPQTRGRVEKAARELSFAISRSASSLVTGKTRRIAVLTPHLDSWFLGNTIAGVSGVLREAELDLLVYSVTDLAERGAFFDRLPARRNADALLVTCFDLTPEERARLDALGMPVVFVSQHVPGRPSVYIDDVDSAQRGMRHLLNLGHRRIAFLQSSDDTGFHWSSKERLTGYRKTLEEAGLPYDEELVLYPVARHRRGIREAVGHLLSLRTPPTAVFAESDEVAIEVMGVLRSSGVDVPGRMSVLGFDDHHLAEWLDLTTVAQPVEDIGRAAAELARSIIDDPEADPTRHVVFPTRVIPRGSTAPPTPPPAGAQEDPPHPRNP
ncbi:MULTISPECIES: LacI family DNA-binding transcriptional regulator [Streptomyces]|uniref:LacI family DNA-binding transcriptional regulator n=1 Tax=Streptomyces lycopersici TaxID=2974589 RepID=UPI00293F137B|nr:LacI family DNA-binding transcriptional regulator [Streptomyces sp. NEAU-383]